QVLFATLGKNRFHESYQLGNEVLNVDLEQFIPNPTKVLESSEDGSPTLKLVIAGANGREEYYLQQGVPQRFNRTIFNFAESAIPGAVNLAYRNDSLLVRLPAPMTVMQMATQRRDTLQPGVLYPLLVRSLYSNESINFVISEFNPKATILWSSTDPKMRSESVAGLQMRLSSGDSQETAFVIGGKGRQGFPVRVPVGDLNVSIAYGTKPIDLPFSIALRDFIMERYPGTNSASSYASEVTLRDARKGLSTDYRIYMNNILNYDGYRFFQSSYDRDELGTVLSVNHDFWGTWISYLGYFLLTVGMIMTLFSKKSRFSSLARTLRKARNKGGAIQTATVLLALMAFLPGQLQANAIIEDEVHQISQQHAEEFGRLIVQDHKGRMKPMNTMASEILRKVARKE
ncbi:MAG: cytochrome c biogenesis protein ResB, partial [Saprospiraceae bacterium]|nr:cytochrome c biogenesis protein ResB [Saprospiraceae bacterium]